MVRRIIWFKWLNFYVIGARRLNPELHSKPLAVVNKGKLLDYLPAVEKTRGSELSPSHFRRIFPDAILLPYEEEHYRGLFKEVWDLVSSYSPLVEPTSFDQGFVDLTGCGEEVPIQELARELQSRVYNKTGLKSRAGGGSNKLLAQLASEKEVFLTPEKEREFIRATPVRALSRLRAQELEQLERLGVSTLGDLAHLPIFLLASIFKERAKLLHQLSLGADPNPVLPLYPPRVIEEEAEFEEAEDSVFIENWLSLLSKRLSHRLGEKGEEASHITLSMSSIKGKREKRRQLLHPISSRGEVFRAARSLFRKLWQGEPLTGLVLALSYIRSKKGAQLDLWHELSETKDRRENLKAILNLVKERYGYSSLAKGLDLPKRKQERMAQLIFREQGRFLF